MLKKTQVQKQGAPHALPRLSVGHEPGYPFPALLLCLIFNSSDRGEPLPTANFS